jgi:hypothetical protein
MEIASNDGYLLQHFVAAGIPVLGIEPAANVAAIAQQKGVPTAVEFFGAATARSLRAERAAGSVTRQQRTGSRAGHHGFRRRHENPLKEAGSSRWSFRTFCN